MVKAAGQTALQPCELRFVRPDELGALVALHRLVHANLESKEVFRFDSETFMQQHLGRRGRTVGAFTDGMLIGYAAISFPGDDADNLGRDLPLPDDELAYVADYDGSAVHPAFRGNRLQQKLTDIRHDYALLNGRFHILGTVSPINPVSLGNFLAMGCRVRNIKRKYGGDLRFIIYRDLRDAAPQPLESTTFVDVVLTDENRHARLLHLGFQGFRVVESAQGPSLRLGLPASIDAMEERSRSAAGSR
ncbi:MAG: hypothetical protein IPK66_10395 [Rhodospirillales bacterium]|nr:hypothetical protein [Rhodospirillales bacterium]